MKSSYPSVYRLEPKMITMGDGTWSLSILRPLKKPPTKVGTNKLELQGLHLTSLNRWGFFNMHLIRNQIRVSGCFTHVFNVSWQRTRLVNLARITLIDGSFASTLVLFRVNAG